MLKSANVLVRPAIRPVPSNTVVGRCPVSKIKKAMQSKRCSAVEKAAAYAQRHPVLAGILTFIAAPVVVLATISLTAIAAGGVVVAITSLL